MSEDLRHSVTTSLRWSVAAKACGQALSWVMTLFVVRLLMPSDYGLMAMANVMIGLLGMVAELGLGASLVQSRSIDEDRTRKVLGAAVVINIGVAVVLALGAPLVAEFYREPRLTAIVRVSALQLPLAVLGLVPDATLRRGIRFKEIAIAGVVSGLIGTGVTLILAYATFGVWALVVGALVTVGARALFLQVYAPQRTLPAFRMHGIRDLVSFGIQITAIRTLWYTFSQADILIAGKLLGGQVLGMYAVAVHLATLPMQRISSIVNDVAFPAFARIQHDPTAVSINLMRGIRLMSTLAFPLLWGAASVAPELVRVVLGSNWIEVTVPLQIIAAVIPLRMINSVVATAFVAIGAARTSLLLSVLGTGFAIVAYYIGARHGILGLSVSWVAITPIVTYLTWARALPGLRTSFSEVLGEMWRPALAAAFMVAVLSGVREVLSQAPGPVRLVILVVAGAATYAGATLLVNRRPAIELVDLLVPGWRARVALAIDRKSGH